LVPLTTDFLDPAPGFFVSDTTRWIEGESYFYSYLRRLQKAAANRDFFPRLTAQVEIFLFIFARAADGARKNKDLQN